jgi:hypothetical protein
MCNNRRYVVLDLGSNVINNMFCAFRFPGIGVFPCLQRDTTQLFSHSPVPIPSVTPSIPRLPAQFGVWHVRVALNLKLGNREYSLLRARDQYLGNLLPDVPKQTCTIWEELCEQHLEAGTKQGAVHDNVCELNANVLYCYVVL